MKQLKPFPAIAIFIFQLICTQFLSIHALQAQTPKKELIDRLITSLYEQNYFNGAVVIGEYGNVVLGKGYGYADFIDSIPFTIHTPVDGGSNAKTITAASILWLHNHDKLSIENPVRNYFPGFPYPEILVQNLITHATGGFPFYEYYYNNVNDTADVTNTSIVKALSNGKPELKYKTGSHFFYDSPAFDIAAALVEKTSGQPYQDFIETLFLKPLNMENAFVRPSKLKEFTNRVKGYRYLNDSLLLYDIGDREGFFGGSNIWFSASDLYKWGTSFYYNPVLSQREIELIKSPVFINNKKSSLTLGAWYHGSHDGAYYYWGSLQGFYTWVYWDEIHQFTIAFVSNTNTPQWLHPQITNALVAIMEGKNSRELAEPVADTINNDQLQQLAGTYNVKQIGKIKLLIKGEDVLLQAQNGLEYHMYQVDKKTFYVPGLEAWLSFNKLSDGKIKINYESTNIISTGVLDSK